MAFLRYASIALILVGCGPAIPTFDGIKIDEWKADKNGCARARAGTIKQLDKQKDKIQGLSEMDVVGLLGRPDETELYTRNQKFYYYYLEPGKNCGTGIPARRLSVRFNATGFAKEITIEEFDLEQQKTAFNE